MARFLKELEQVSLTHTLMIRFVTALPLMHYIAHATKYAEAFSPYLGTLPPDAIARSLKLGVLSKYLLVGLSQRCVSTSAATGREVRCCTV
jgi:hypothetical protein